MSEIQLASTAGIRVPLQVEGDRVMFPAPWLRKQGARRDPVNASGQSPSARQPGRRLPAFTQ